MGKKRDNEKGYMDNESGVDKILIIQASIRDSSESVEACTSLSSTSGTQASATTSSLSTIPTIQASQATGSEDSLIILVDASSQKIAPPATIKTSAAMGRQKRKYKTTGKTRRVPALRSDQKTLDESKAEWQEFKHPGRANFDWGKKTLISKLNAWRTRNFNNFESDKAGAASRPQGNPRARWCHVEKEFIEIMLEKMIKKTGTALSGKDWQKLAKKHNDMFKGTKIIAGERLFNGKAATKSEIIGEKYHDEGDTTDEDEDSGPGGPVKDANLERGSDDEMDDQRPAAQPTGGVPVASTCFPRRLSPSPVNVLRPAAGPLAS
ncbi:hypothetical protein LZ554_003717 [Drepanopeziza brunnea f. sp. 'monogermtubi']|nr:hypothetical protein LZ554_003717 [Drepanopeziza brunnea f. sp. 'monogermtubi']